MKYVAKPVVIEARIWTGLDDKNKVLDFMDGACRIVHDKKGNPALYIPTDHGGVLASPGDYVIKGNDKGEGIEGKFYPCRPNVFRKKYKKA